MHFKQFGIAVVVLAVLLVVFGFWANHVPRKVSSVEEQHVLAGTSTSAGDFEYKESGAYYDITARYPAKTGFSADADAKARLAVEHMLADRIAEFKRNTNVESLSSDDAGFLGLGENRKYSLDLQYKTYTAPEYVSYLYTVFEDTGGAHPNTYFMSVVFNSTGEKMTLATLFPTTQNLLQKLSSAVEASVTAQYKERAQVTNTEGLLFAEGFAPKGENFQNFVIDGTTLRIFLPPYQVAAYAAGAFEVAIPLQNLQ